MTGETKATEIGDDELLLTRVFNAPRELVFKAWIDPKMMAEWWGPTNMTNPIVELDARNGGRYHIVMRAPDGTDYPCDGTFLEIVPYERIVMIDEVIDHPKEWFEQLNKYRKTPAGDNSLSIVLTITFEDLGRGKTKLDIMHRFRSAADREAIIKMGHEEGFSESLDKLAALLARS